MGVNIDKMNRWFELIYLATARGHQRMHRLFDSKYDPPNMKIRLYLLDRADFKRTGWKRNVRGDWELFGS